MVLVPQPGPGRKYAHQQSKFLSFSPCWEYGQTLFIIFVSTTYPTEFSWICQETQSCKHFPGILSINSLFIVSCTAKWLVLKNANKKREKIFIPMEKSVSMLFNFAHNYLQIPNIYLWMMRVVNFPLYYASVRALTHIWWKKNSTSQNDQRKQV